MGACCGPARRGPEPSSTSWDGPAAEVLRRLAEQADDSLTMVGLAGGAFRMGADDPLAYPEDGEGPVREVVVAPFAVGATTVTVAQFAAFVAETGHRTDAEVHGVSFVFQGLLPADVERSAPRVADAPWWRGVTGACWFRPEGPGSSVEERVHHPVTHVSQRDAVAYADWVGARLPTEAEWELAARGGLDQQPFPWGDVREPDGVPRMNTFRGEFPDRPSAPVGTCDVTMHAPNAFGLFNMTGNVWEWTSGTFAHDAPDPVLRGGSYLCHASYCRRYRTSARTSASADSSLGHTGFRLALSTG